MAKLNDTLVDGNLSCLNTISAPYWTSDGSVKVSAHYNNEFNAFINSGNTLYFNYRGGTNSVYFCNGSGAVTGGAVTAGTFNATSDARLKENIQSYNCSKSILDLDVKRFDFINGPKNQIGCIAQELKEICPEIITENENGYLSIQESKIVYLLLQELKAVKQEVADLKEKLK